MSDKSKEISPIGMIIIKNNVFIPDMSIFKTYNSHQE
jgi:hypothetical protein